MDNATNVKPRQGVGQMAEVAGNTGQVGGMQGVRPGGLYRHAENGKEIVTFTHPLFGDVQSRAAERAGFVYVGPAPEGFVKTVGIPSASHEANKPAREAEATAAYNKGLEARMNALEARNAVLENQLASGTQVPGTEPVKGSEETKQAAADKTAEQTGVQVDPKTGDEVEHVEPDYETDEHDADEPSHKELQKQAKELGVNAKGSREELTQRVAEAKAEKENK